MPRHLLPSLLVAIVLPCGAQGLPDLGDISSTSLSETQERTIGNRIMREIRTDPAFIDDAEIADYIKVLGSRLLGAADNPRRDLEFFVVLDESINAFALVGGHVGIFSGLIALTANESELAGVLAHEIAHVLQRHQARAIHGGKGAQMATLAALALAILASRSGSSQAAQVTEAAIASASALAIQSQIDYTREHEREADRVAVSMLERAGLDPRGLVTFFEKMQRANRLNEVKGSTPSYLRTHPLNTERIASAQDRVERLSPRMVPDSFDYRLARARIRALSGSASVAIAYFRGELADKTVLRPREDTYGLALALRRAREFEEAWKVLAPLRTGDNTHPAFELLAAQIRTEQGRVDEALGIHKLAAARYPQHRGLTHARITLWLEQRREKEALAELEERLRGTQDDPKLYELQARAFEASGRRLAQHRAQAEGYFRRGNLPAAVDQLEIAVKVKGGDFYELSGAEARLRELRALLENEKAAEKALKIE